MRYEGGMDGERQEHQVSWYRYRFKKRTGGYQAFWEGFSLSWGHLHGTTLDTVVLRRVFLEAVTTVFIYIYTQGHNRAGRSGRRFAGIF